jgi:ParB/RepB/Spo0J family partition protein
MNPVKVTYQYHNFICAKHFGVYADGYKQPMGFIAIEEIADEDLTGIKAKLLSEKEIGMKMREFIIKEEMAEDSSKNNLLAQDSKMEEKVMFENDVNIEEIAAKDSKKENINNETSLVKEENMEKAKESEGKGNDTPEMELKLIDINSITVPKHHPRIDPGDISDLQGSIRRDGMQEPLFVYVTEQGYLAIIDGSRRLKAAKEMGFQQVSCLIKKGLSEADAVHLSYVKNFERKTLSAIEIARHIKTMQKDFGYTLSDLELKGYGSQSSIGNKLKLLDLPDKIQAQIQDGTFTAAHGQALVKLPTREEQARMAKRIVDFDMTVKKADAQITRYLSKKRKSKKDKPIGIQSGDLQGVYFKDARDMSELPDKSVHLIVSSPPYFVGMEFEVGMTFKEHLENVEAVIKECARVIVQGGVIALNVADITNFKGNNDQSDSQIKLMAHFYQSCLKKHKIYLTDQIIWAKRIAWSKLSDSSKSYKEDTVHTSYSIYPTWEPIYIYRAKGERELPSEEIILKSKLTREQWMSYVNGVWKIEPVRNTDGHPCMYPDELVNRLVRMFSYVGDTVLDPFLGSGTTVKVARDLERMGIGYERELKYKPVIMKKLGLNPDEAVADATTMAEYREQTMPPEENAVKSSKPEAAFFGNMTLSEATEEEVAEEETVN